MTGERMNRIKIAELEEEVEFLSEYDPGEVALHTDVHYTLATGGLAALLCLARAAKGYRSRLNDIRDRIAAGEGARGLTEADGAGRAMDEALDAFDWD